MLLSGVAIILMLAMDAWILLAGSDPAPMSGTVTKKLYYPEYAWKTDNMPWEYALHIEHKDGRRACVWYVSRAIYERHEVGDQIVRGWW